MNILDQVQDCLKQNDNKLSYPFIKELAEAGTTTYLQPTPSMRMCVIKLESGHEVYGVAQVLDPANDVEEIGNEVAYTNAVNELWKTIGSIAKVYV